MGTMAKTENNDHKRGKQKKYLHKGTTAYAASSILHLYTIGGSSETTICQWVVCYPVSQIRIEV